MKVEEAAGGAQLCKRLPAEEQLFAFPPCPGVILGETQNPEEITAADTRAGYCLKLRRSVRITVNDETWSKALEVLLCFLTSSWSKGRRRQFQVAIACPQEVPIFFPLAAEGLVRLAITEYLSLSIMCAFSYLTQSKQLCYYFAGNPRPAHPFSASGIPCWEFRSVGGLLQSPSYPCLSGWDWLWYPGDYRVKSVLKRKGKKCYWKAFSSGVWVKGMDVISGVGECLLKWRTRT